MLIIDDNYYYKNVSVLERVSNTYFLSVCFPVETEVESKIRYSSWFCDAAAMEIAAGLFENPHLLFTHLNQNT